MSPTPEDIRRQLDRILASDAFVGAERSRRFLRYVVERTLEGEGDRLKEFVIGADVFDRGTDYDPRIDSIVRVEAGRLRTRLEQYYQTRDDAAIVIRMRRGSYMPSFEMPAPVNAGAVPVDDRPVPAHPVAEFVAAPPTSPAPARTGFGWPWRVAALAAALVVAVLGFGALLATGRRVPTHPTPPPSPVVVAVLPFTHFSIDPNEERLAARLTDGVTGELVRMGTVDVVAQRNAQQFASSGRPMQDAIEVLQADIVIVGSVILDQEQVKVDVRVVDPSVARKRLGTEVVGEVTDIPGLQRRVAEAVADATAGGDSR